MSNKKKDLFGKIEELPSRLYVILAVIVLAIHIVVCTYTDAAPSIVGIVLLSVYAVISLIVYLSSHRRLQLFRIEADASEQQNSSVIYAFRNSLSIPYAVVTEHGKS